MVLLCRGFWASEGECLHGASASEETPRIWRFPLLLTLQSDPSSSLHGLLLQSFKRVLYLSWPQDNPFPLSAQNPTLTPISVAVEGQGLIPCVPAKLSWLHLLSSTISSRFLLPLHLTGISLLRVCDLAVPSAWNILGPDRSISCFLISFKS